MNGEHVYKVAGNCCENPAIRMSMRAFADCLGINPVTLSNYGGKNRDQQVSGTLAKMIELVEARPEVLLVLREDL